MLNVIWWYIAVQAVGLAAFPLAYFLLPRLADRGYSLSKPLGLLVLGYLSWILGVLHLLPSVRLSITGLLLVLGGLSGWYAWRRRQELKEFFVRERRAVIAIEAVFLLFFIGWAVFRAYDPYINHTEQPMDHAFLSASAGAFFGQPEDPWLRGESISYYYFGYWIMGVLGQLTGIPSNIAYNLSLALVPALAASSVFGLAYGLVRSEAANRAYALAAGTGAALFLGVASNLEGVLEFMRANGMGSQGFWKWLGIEGLQGAAAPSQSWTPEEFWWWFRASRVINTFEDGQGLDYTIQEFPFFSFLLGDLHPHMMAIPFVVLFMGLTWGFLRGPVHRWLRPDPHSYASLGAIGLVLGGLAFLNMWDLPTFAALFLGAAVLKTYREEGRGFWTLLRRAAPLGAFVLLLAFVLYLPYFVTFRGGVEGVGATDITARPVHLLIVWGLFLTVVAPFILRVFWETTVRDDWRRAAFFALAVPLLPFLAWAFLHLEGGGSTDDLAGRLLHVLPLVLLIGMAVYSAFWLVTQRGPTGRLYAVLLSALGLMMIMGPELLFIRDSFDNRMNTVFKLYYQSWIMLAVASGFVLYYWASLRASLSGLGRSLTTLWAGVFVVLAVASLYYPLAAGASKGELSGHPPTLDGLSYVRQGRPAEYEAIEFLRREANSNPGVAEAVGEWFDFGLISRSTGISTVVNWPGHQVQWRGSPDSFAGREQEVARMYQTQDAQEAKNLLEKYDVEYVYVGPRERDAYGPSGLEKFPSFMDEVFRRDDIVIYKLRD